MGKPAKENQVDFASRLLASIGQPVVVVDPEFRVVYLNRGAEQTLGWTTEEMLGVDIISAAGIHLTDQAAEALIDALAAGREVREDFHLTRRDGTRIPVLVNLTPFLDEDGSFAGMVAVASDISERYAMEQANSRLSAIVESSSDAIIGFDLDGTVTSWNPAAVALTGAEASSRIGRHFDDIATIDRWTGPTLQSRLGEVAAGKTVRAEGELHRIDGTTIHIEVIVHPVRDRRGAVAGGAAIIRDTTARFELEQRVATEHQRLEEAQQIAKIGSFDLTVATGELRWSRELRRIVGLAEGDPDSLDVFLERVHPDDLERFTALFTEVYEGRADFEIAYRLVLPGGEVRWLHTIGRADYDEEGVVAHVVGSSQDITERRAEEEARLRAEQQFAVAFEHGNVGMLILGLDRTIQRVNPTICRMLDRRPEELLGRSPDDFSDPNDVWPAGHTLTDLMLTSPRGQVEAERRYLRPDGDVLHALVHLALVRDNDGEPLYTFAQVVDITDRKKTEDELERLAMQDPLTGLPNRNLLADRLATALHRSQRTKARVAVLFVDIDHFKLVNDSLGHAAGDDLLRQLAHRLEACTRAGDTIARFGGDEFVLVCEDVHDAEEATAIGARVREVCNEPFLIDDQLMYVTVSAGIVVATEGDTPATLLRDADTAMYRAKERGRARAELFDPALRSRTTRRLDIELALRHALDRGEFHLVYQPVVRLPDDVPVGVEALIRWDHPERGLLPPAEFVPAAEETGLIGPIGDWVLETAIEQTARWRRHLAGAEQLTVAVNLSARQLTSGDLVDRARDLLEASDLSPDALCLEITETAAMDDLEVTLPILRRIAESGIALAVDDFGSGHSSLSRLKRLPARLLKIDRSFVDGLGEDADDSSIVHAIVSLGLALDLLLCAEGVETADQRAVLVQLGCHTGQGYLWSKPLLPEEFEQWFGAARFGANRRSS